MEEHTLIFTMQVLPRKSLPLNFFPVFSYLGLFLTILITFQTFRKAVLLQCCMYLLSFLLILITLEFVSQELPSKITLSSSGFQSFFLTYSAFSLCWIFGCLLQDHIVGALAEHELRTETSYQQVTALLSAPPQSDSILSIFRSVSSVIDRLVLSCGFPLLHILGMDSPDPSNVFQPQEGV